MSLSEGYVEHLKEQLDGIGHITVRRMFGGAGVYCDGFIFAFLDEDVLYLKTDEPGRAPFEAEGMGPFTYESKDGPSRPSRITARPSACSTIRTICASGCTAPWPSANATPPPRRSGKVERRS